jgi:hypothetical protein
MESERTSLSPSGWMYWSFLDPGYARRWLAGCLPVPLVVIGIVLGWQWLTVLAAILSGVAQLLAIRGERDAFFTAARVHRRTGLLGLAVEDIPIHDVYGVTVESIPLYPEMGNVVVECRLTRLRFEFVPDVQAKASRLQELARAAQSSGSGRPLTNARQ